MHIINARARDHAHMFVLSNEAASSQVATDCFPEQKMIVNGSKKQLIRMFDTPANIGRIGLSIVKTLVVRFSMYFQCMLAGSLGGRVKTDHGGLFVLPKRSSVTTVVVTTFTENFV